MKRWNWWFSALFFLALIGPVSAQDDFGFGFGEEDAASGGTGSSSIAAGPFALGIGGKASSELVWYAGEFSSYQKFSALSLGNIFAGRLNFKAAVSNAEGIINLKLKPDFARPASIVSFDEAYVRGYFGAFDVEGGLRKLTWGKADSLGPLDVINPLDYTDLTGMTDILDKKIARPLIHGSYRLGSFSKVEGVFVPWFEGHRFAQDANDRWAPRQLTDLPGSIARAVLDKTPDVFRQDAADKINGILTGNNVDLLGGGDQYTTLEYAQAGLRFTTSIGPADLGIQYYSGFLPRPAAWIPGIDEYAGAGSTAAQAAAAYEQAQTEAVYLGQIASQFPTPANISAAQAAVQRAQELSGQAQAAVAAFETAGNALQPKTAYNRYHQIGVDYAQVIAGFNVRAEAAANITGDLSGNDGGIYNPSLGWSVGFDRDLFWGINFNFQGTGSIRLLNDKISDNRAIDTEAGTSVTATRLMFVLSRKFLRDELEIRATALWGIEDMDCYIIPAVIWTRGDLALELSGGIFGGDKKGELGQYRSNGFIKTALTYSF